MSLANLITDPSPLEVSFEFSPPKTDEAEAQRWLAIRRLEPLAPSFVSVTYGAGGSTRERTHATVKRIVDETTLQPAAPLNCVAHPRHARRHAGHDRRLSAASRRLRLDARSHRRHQGGRALRGQRLVLSREP